MVGDKAGVTPAARWRTVDDDITPEKTRSCQRGLGAFRGTARKVWVSLRPGGVPRKEAEADLRSTPVG